MIRRFLHFSIVAAISALASGAPATAGPYIIAGTDADDHGFVSGGVNRDGWFFMQRALENIAPGVTNGNKTVVFLGSDPGTQAGNAAQSAFDLSTLPGLGWTASFVNGVTDITNFFTSGLAATGIIMLDSGANVGGGIGGSEEAQLTTNATVINNFLGGGGGLFTQANSLGFLTTLLPSLVVNSLGTGGSGPGITLTAAGSAAFPGLTNADLGAGPYHAVFTNTGAVPVLGRETFGNQLAVIIGASGGTITDPTPVPVPASFAILAAGLAGLLVARRRA